ncbi:uncharacterized protein LOC126738522 [Anthonomus grandis grandis]|uniref:uncharacterized protein LOC126738522 n=1 Tax=Anthonomus grandis grandis TaxID=2921223 RepID=UPI002165BE58|nr:uncharacterized protein LOC126738522 [Anthonomus grandis grandis]
MTTHILQNGNYNDNLKKRKIIRNLCIIATLESLSYGLMYRFITAHISQRMGANQIHVGILQIGLCLGDLISPEVTNTLTLNYSRRKRLLFILSVTLLTILMIGTPLTPTNYWFVILTRIFFSLINQTQASLVDLLSKELDSNSYEKLLIKYNILSKFGLIAGPICAGYLYGIDEGFEKICSLSAVLTFINIVILTKTPIQEISHEQITADVNPSIVRKTKQVLMENIKDFEQSDLGTNWDLLLIRYLFVGSFWVFMAKVRKIMVHHYNIKDPVSAGFTVAFITFLDFIFGYYTSKSHAVSFKVFPSDSIADLMLFLATVLMALTIWMPTFQLFLLLTVPVIFIRHEINYIWPTVFCTRKNVSLYNLNTTTGQLALLTVPLIFGVSYETFGPAVLIIFTCVPLIFSWIIARLYTRYLRAKRD